MTDSFPVTRTGAESQGSAPVFRAGSDQAGEAKQRIVFDTNILLSMYVFVDSRFAPFLRQVENGHWQALTSTACLDEFRRVLAYPEFELDPDAQARIVAAYLANVELVPADPAPSVQLPRCQDRDDQKFLELARDGHAHWLISADKALLKLARRDRLRGLFAILAPEAALNSTPGLTPGAATPADQ